MARRVKAWRDLEQSDAALRGALLELARRGETLSLSEEALWEPNAGPQVLALESEADELYYGGQAGGGKTDLLIGAALTRHTKSVIFRREYRQLRDVAERLRSLISGKGSYNANEQAARLHDGRVIELGACQYEYDKENWQGRAHDLKAFDEVPHFSLSQYLYLCGWNRTATVGQRCRVIAAGNPPMSTEGEWVLDRWALWLDDSLSNRAMPGEIRYFVSIDGEDTEVPSKDTVEYNGEWLYPRSRTFIPASLDDNPYIDNSYRSALDQMPEPIRSLLKYGQHKIIRTDHPWQVIPSKWVEDAQSRWKDMATYQVDCIGLDPARGGSDRTALVKRSGDWCAKPDVYLGKDTPDGPSVAALCMQFVDSRINLDPIGIGASVLDVLTANGLYVEPVNFASKGRGRDRSGNFKFANKRAECYWKMRELLDPETGSSIALPPGREIASELCAARYSVQQGGITVEPKDKIRERLGRSPDVADAIVLAFYSEDSTIQTDPDLYAEIFDR